MTVEKMIEWLQDKNKNRRIVFLYDGMDVTFEDIGLSVEEKEIKQGELFNDSN